MRCRKVSALFCPGNKVEGPMTGNSWLAHGAERERGG